jgi:hypothetical protein
MEKTVLIEFLYVWWRARITTNVDHINQTVCNLDQDDLIIAISDLEHVITAVLKHVNHNYSEYKIMIMDPDWSATYRGISKEYTNQDYFFIEEEIDVMTTFLKYA